MTITTQQLLDRRSGIGGSDCAAALGVSPWKSPRELYEDKVSDEPPAPVTSGPMLWGNLLEPLLAERYRALTGFELDTSSVTRRHHQHEFMLAHLDGIARDGAQAARGVEFKTSRSAEGWGEPGSSDIPVPYSLQVQHCMIVAGLSVFDVFVLIGGSDERLYTVEADRELQQMIVEHERQFWAHVITRTPPPIDLDDSRALDVVRRVYRGTTGERVIATDTDTQWRNIYRDALARRDRYAAVADNAKAHLLDRMGNAAELQFDDGELLTRQFVKRKGYTVEPYTYLESRFRKAKDPK